MAFLGIKDKQAKPETDEEYKASIKQAQVAFGKGKPTA